MRLLMICLLVWLASFSSVQGAQGWEWQFSLGPWTLEPWTSPVERQAEEMVSTEAGRLLAPLLSEFTVFAITPRVEMRSRGWSATVGCWRRLKNDRIALGVSASYLDFSLPFSLTDEREITLQGIPLARISTSGQGRVDLHTFMLTLQGRWRIVRTGRIALHAGMGLTLLGFNGNLYLPLTATVQSFLGTVVLRKTEDETLAELRTGNSDIPAWILAPAVSLSLHYRLGNWSRILIDFSLSQGTSLAVGISLGH